MKRKRKDTTKSSCRLIKKQDIKIIIPVYNEEKTIGKLLIELKKLGWLKSVICVDDCSKDKSAQIIQKFPVVYLKHPINRGLGGALRTGFEAAKILKTEIAVTMDADLQHKPEELQSMVQPFKDSSVDVVIGTRIHDTKGMPLVRQFANRLGNFITKVLYGIQVTDSQSGFRAFRKRALQKLNLKTSRMEISSEIIAQIKKQKLKFVEVPISAVYTDYSLSKGQSFKTGLKTMAKLIIARFR